ncbi:MAG: DUF2163 domain-containing protein [Rhodobacteraceae bacterium]|nr:DUF2163 domain-containing protein [Paracoccaceae bacterium]
MTAAPVWPAFAGGEATVARAVALTREDGVTLGFTDHDAPLVFEGITFRPESGADLAPFAATTGLAPDLGELAGALRSDALTEADLAAGRWGGAEVRVWLVNWADTGQRSLVFRGRIGEVRRAGQGFAAELRGLGDILNRPTGRVFQRDCSAVLGDARCGIDLDMPQHWREGTVIQQEEGRVFVLGDVPDPAERWFERGVMKLLDGPGAGLSASVKGDRFVAGGGRRIELWEPVAAVVPPGARVRLVAGCDRRAGTCRAKFGNLANFRGFPDIPGEDWLIAYPVPGSRMDGGSRRR